MEFGGRWWVGCGGCRPSPIRPGSDAKHYELAQQLTDGGEHEQPRRASLVKVHSMVSTWRGGAHGGLLRCTKRCSWKVTLDTVPQEGDARRTRRGSRGIVHPKPAPVQIATVEELQPLIQWMTTKEAPVEGEEGEFDKGTVIGGDAVDLCKPWSVTRALRRFLPSFEPAQVP